MPTSMPPIRGSVRSPLPSASVPRTSWKYCGIANRMPNIANDTSVARIVPQANPAERNSDSSISGRTRPTAEPPLASLRWVSRCSQATSPASTTAPAAIVASAVGSVQPSWPARMTPYVSAISPALEITTPAQSTRGRSALRDSGIRKVTAISANSTTGTLIRNTDPHQKWSSRAPPTSGPMGKLRKMVEAMTAVARCRSSGANSTGMMASASGMIAAAPRPSTARAAISSPAEAA